MVSLEEYLVQKRRLFHQYPELGFHEFDTAKVIQKELESFGFEVIPGIAKTGVIGILKGRSDSPVIMLRFDMDALPIQEENVVDYQSVHAGVMHACGHDAHMAIGLGVARELQTLRNDLNATIKLVFQPAEEGLGGAAQMIAEKVLTNPRPDYCLGMHVWNEKPVGWVAITPGAFMAGADTFKIEIYGKGGHGALPQDTKDPIIAAAQIIQILQTIISRNLAPLDSGVISVGSINSGSAFNIIPQNVELKGTIRYFDEKTRQLIHSRMKSICKGVADAMECSIQIVINEITPALINNSNVASLLIEKIMPKFSALNLEINYRSMVSEDYSFYLQQIPGCFIFLGSGFDEPSLRFGHHHPKFNINENVMPISVAFLVDAVKELANERNEISH